ncbi:MAG: RNA methyltransferase [Oscillibacter sp.]|jgi:TrmH family RNA methyltransferase|uniref:TrmH family RNA methyltransferase n=1 Tax=uncultured Oscillibacter sp. TaxID=876091 RepID=UPI0021700CDD|nr:RNA methyltransferase [uncultured Oscillibacter sp.]MCI9644566.1 RNA methyltransferase [Oscillibacter sp.]
MEIISSKSNSLCVHLRKLASSRSYREETGEFLCDSPKLLGEAVLWGADITALLCAGEVELPQGLEGRVPRVAGTSEAVMRSVSPMETPQGVVFSCRSPGCRPPERLEPDGQGRMRFLVLDGVQDPGNVGTILRTADAFGTRVVLLPGCADLYNPKTLRAGMGAHFRSAACRCTLEELTALLKTAELPLYGAALREDTEDVRKLDLSRCAMAVGSEGRGLSAAVLAACSQTVRIPMNKTCESLNAASAASVLLWEAARREI